MVIRQIKKPRTDQSTEVKTLNKHFICLYYNTFIRRRKYTWKSL